MILTIEQVKANGWLVFEAIVGSKAYGLDTDKSDTDIRGVFVLPKELFYSLEYTAQVSNESNDIVYYELKKFIELLAKNNPNILEMLQLPEACILYRHELMNWIKPDMFLSKLCEKSFANYAYTQIQKARGLEKKISWHTNHPSTLPSSLKSRGSSSGLFGKAPILESTTFTSLKRSPFFGSLTRQ